MTIYDHVSIIQSIHFWYPSLNPVIFQIVTNLVLCIFVVGFSVDSAAIDVNAKIPEEVLKQLGELGLFGQQIPHDYGKSMSYMSRITRKPVFGVPDQVRHEPGCTNTEDG